jgi:hypothetical protein
LRRFWRSKVRPTWRDVRTPLVLLTAIAVLILGTVGYTKSSGDYDWFEAFVKSFQLFAFAGGDVSSSDPLSLNIAKLLAPLLVGYAAIRGLLVLSREQLRLVGFRIFRRNHVIVVGLGDVGFRLADVLNNEGARVIAIDRDLTHASAEVCRERGISVLAGDGTDRGTLRAARVDRAAHLVVAPGTDAVTIDVIAAAREIAGGRTGAALRILAHIEGPVLWRALRARALSESGPGEPRVEPFNLYEAAGRLILAEHPPFEPSEAGGRGGPTALIASDQPLGEILVLNVARVWRNERARDRARIAIDFAAPDAEHACQQMLARNPALESVCELRPWPLELASSDLRSDRAASAATAYVALGDEADGLASSLMIASSGPVSPRVVLVINDESLGVASVASDAGAGEIDIFGILNRTLTPDFLLTGLTDLIARAMHESYVRDQLALGKGPDELPYLESWHELDDEGKRKNRDFAADIRNKLNAVDRVAVPTALVDLDRDGARFDAGEIERLARLEHERWMRDEAAAGWSYGPVRNDEARTHPSMRPYDEISEEEKDKDRAAVRDLPRMLAEAGFAIERG